ncbi:MAG: hypothetical protein IKY43_03345, partial [Bacteroidales bacterium]|nr:hypothetical protein [Bacteroidales bacterium]
VEVTPEEAEKNNARLRYEDSLRNAYTSTFPKKEDVKDVVNKNLTAEQLWEFVHKSEGNYAEMIGFLQNEKMMVVNENFPLYDFLKSLSDKDLRDCEASTLLQFAVEYNPQSTYTIDVYKKGILPARISNELLRPYHNYLKENLVIEDADAQKVINWIAENITINDDENYYNCPISPKGVFDLRHSDKHSANIFFVAACRSLDIPAYLDNATNQLFAYNEGVWKNYSLEEDKPKTETGKLLLEYNGGGEIKPQYWIHYTLAKYEMGDFVTFDFENDPRTQLFPVSLDLEPGYYMLSSGNRYSDGTTLSKLVFFNIKAGETTKQALELRTLVPRKENYGKIDLSTQAPWNTDATLASEVKDKDFVLAFIDPNREPTRHLFNDIEIIKSQFEKWNGKMVFIVPEKKITDDFDTEKLMKKLPKNATLWIDKNSDWMNMFLKTTDTYFRSNYPLVFIINSKGELTFKTEGYRIGTGELIFKSLER